MRTSIVLKPLGILLWFIALPHLVFGGQRNWVGRDVMIKSPGVKLQVGRRLGPVPFAEIMTVEQVRGDWLWVGNGWLPRDKVVSLDEAATWFTAQIRNRPTPFAYVSRAAARVEKGDYNGAIEDCTMALKIDPRCEEAYDYRATARGNQKNFAEAINDCDHAIRLKPNAGSNYSKRGALRLYLADYHGALADANSAMRLDARDPSSYALRGEARFYLEDYRHALSDLTYALQFEPESSWLHDFCGACKGQLGKLDEAIKDFDKAIELNPQFAGAYSNRGWYRFIQGRYDEARADLDAAIRIDPKLVRAWGNRAHLLECLGELAKAADDYAEVLRLSEGWVGQKVLARLPTKKLRIKNTEVSEALGEMVLTVERVQGDWLWVGRGWIQARDVMTVEQVVSGYANRLVGITLDSNLDSALHDCDVALRLAPNDTYLYGLRASVRQLKGDDEGAELDVQRGIEVAPSQSAMLLSMRASALRQCCDYARAIEMYSRVVSAESTSRIERVLAYVELANIWAEAADLKLRDGRRAIEAATKACELSHWNLPEALSALAAAHAECGEFDDAVRWQTKAAELSPTALQAEFDGEARFVTPSPDHDAGYKLDMAKRQQAYRAGRTYLEPYKMQVARPKQTADPRKRR
jgi:tetratricopeptide (TPR) repeat protein